MADEPKDDIVLKKSEWETLTKKVDGFVGDIQKERQARQEAEAARDLAEAKLKQTPPVPPTDDVTKTVTTLLAQRDTETAQANLKNAEVRFQESHKEFHPDNDPGGIKYAAFKAKLSRFNTSGLRSEADFLAVFDDALRLMTDSPAPQTKVNPPAHTPSGTGSAPTSVTESPLSSKEQQLLKQMGWDEARYLKIKEKRPHYVQTLLNYMQ